MLVEFGIGNARKVSPLLKALNSHLFVGLDISRSALEDALHGLALMNIRRPPCWASAATTASRALSQHPRLEGQRRIGFFPGSSLGNFSGEEAVAVAATVPTAAPRWTSAARA